MRVLRHGGCRLWLLVLLLASPAQAGNFGVTPIRLDLNAASKTGAITVSNDDAEPLTFQIALMEWTQGPDGKDRYAPSSDLVFFPRVMTVEGKTKRLIRVGLKSPAQDRERTYRLFIEETPKAGQDPGKGTAIQVKLRFGVPIFLTPQKPELTAEIVQAQVHRGVASLRVRNTGNRHYRFESLVARSGSRSLGESQGWYLLPGVEREFSVELDAAVCADTGKVEMALLGGDGLDLKRELPVTPAQCRR